MKSMMFCQLFVDLTRHQTKITTSDNTPMRHGNAWIRVFTGSLVECMEEEKRIKASWK